jgi:hypothetical protein
MELSHDMASFHVFMTSICVTGTRGSKNKLVRISFFHASEFNFRSMTCMRLICDLILVN